MKHKPAVWIVGASLLVCGLGWLGYTWAEKRYWQQVRYDKYLSDYEAWMKKRENGTRQTP